MKNSKTLAFLAVAVLAVPAISFAQSGYVSKDVNLRAGPGKDYPAVAFLRTGVTISVVGCLSDYRWCDVIAGPNRGWVYAANIVYPYQGANVAIMTYGAAIGLGIIAFSVGNYWDHHYRARPWYQQRQTWIDRPHSGHLSNGHGPLPGPGVAPGGVHRPQMHAPVMRPEVHRFPNQRSDMVPNTHPTPSVPPRSVRIPSTRPEVRPDTPRPAPRGSTGGQPVPHRPEPVGGRHPGPEHGQSGK